MIRPLFAFAFLIGGCAHGQADGDGTPRQRRGEIDRGERVIRTPDTSQVPADLNPRDRRDIQITVDPYGRRREDVMRTPQRRGLER